MVVQIVTLLLLDLWMPGLQIESVGGSIGVLLVYILTEELYWWLFLNFLSHLPYWLYPIFSAVLTGVLLTLLANQLPGILVVDLRAGLEVAFVMAGVTWLLAGYFSLDLDEQFDLRITRKFISRIGATEKTNIPGLLLLEIDGLSEKNLRKALEENKMPTIKRWIDQGTHKLSGWETDFSSQSGASQAGILLGNNDNIPAYCWWDRQKKRVVSVGNSRDAGEIEQTLSSGAGLLAEGGVSRINVFSGDAKETLFTMSTILKLGKEVGPGFYWYLLNPFVFGRIAFSFLYGVVREWWQALVQWLRRDKLRVRSRNFTYGFIRAGSCQFLHDLTTYILIGDVLRGVPAIYATFLGYDDVAHYTGTDSKEAFQTLFELDRRFARLEHILTQAPRPYQVIVLSDHGQSSGGTFNNVYHIKLKDLVRTSIEKPSDIFAAREVSETWERIGAYLSDPVNKKYRATRLLRTMWESRNAAISDKPDERFSAGAPGQGEGAEKKPALTVIGSGCSGLIYFTEAEKRLTYEEIQRQHPGFILNLTNHAGIGFVMVRSAVDGDLILSKDGVYFLDSDSFEGNNPLADYSGHAAMLLRRESSFTGCPDILVSTRYDPETDTLCGFEDQIGHHGGLGGQQSFPFIVHPRALPVKKAPIVGAEALHGLIKGWRNLLQGQDLTASKSAPPQSGTATDGTPQV
ncbi:MAG: alkaline phosphatase family protein [Anaerolineaceae bacterium]